MIDTNILDLSIKTALTSPSRKKVGAILLMKNRIISTGVNKEKKTHPFQARLAERVGLFEKIYLHAEIHALVNARANADTIVVTRMGGHSHDELRMAKPCPVCSLALEEAGIKNIIYSTNDGFLYKYL